MSEDTALRIHSYFPFGKLIQQTPTPQKAKTQTFSLPLNNSCHPFSLHDLQFPQQTEVHSPHIMFHVLPHLQVILVNTCVTPHVDLQPAGFVILLVTARKRTRKLLLLSEVGSIMGE